jgi:hypothetical protein
MSLKTSKNLYEKRVFGDHESMAAADATDEQIRTRVQEIRTWFKENVSFRKIWETMMEGIDALPKIEMPDVSLPIGEEEKH